MKLQEDLGEKTQETTETIRGTFGENILGTIETIPGSIVVMV